MVMKVSGRTDLADAASSKPHRSGHFRRINEEAVTLQVYWKAMLEKLPRLSLTNVLGRLLAVRTFHSLDVLRLEHRHLRLAASTVFLTGVVLFAGAAPALAQDAGGGGDAIEQTLTNVRNYLAALSFSVGGIGFVASLLVKGYASINENAHAYAAMGMKGSLWCIVAGVIVTPILSIAAGLAGGAG